MRTKLASIGPAVFVVLAFAFSRLFYVRAGLRFDNTPLRHYYQFVDPVLLKTRLFESLWYLHSQPPLFNFISGLLYQRFSTESRIFHLLFLAMGLAFSLALYGLGLRLGLRRWVSALLAAWFMVSPATVLYENLYFYTYPIAFLLVLSALVLSRFLETHKLWWGAGFLGLAASACLIWGVFHLAWLLAVLVLVGAFYRDWRRLALISLAPVVLVSGWYAKNLSLFGTFGASSWTGMNLSHITFLSPLTPQTVREELAAQGKLTPYPVTEAFRPIEHYNDLLPVPPPSGIPVLDEPLKSTKAINFNHSFYIELSRRMLEDALGFIRVRPDLYLSSVTQGLVVYFHSSSDYALFKDKPALQLEHWWERVFYGQLSSYNGDYSNRWSKSPVYVGWWLVVMYVAAAIYGLRLATSRTRSNRVLAGVAAFMTFTLLYFTLTVNFLDLGENNRFRFALDPFALVLFGMLVQDLFVKGLERRSSPENSRA